MAQPSPNVVHGLRADPNPRGGRIDLTWTAPEFAGFAGVRVFRREHTFPADGDLTPGLEVYDRPAALAPPGGADAIADTPLKFETTYYYAVAAYDGAGVQHEPQFVSVMATARYETAEHLYAQLPAVYRRLDTTVPPAVPGLESTDLEKGQLRRFTDLVGVQFDLIRSFTAAARDFSDVGRVDGTALLPLLGESINWSTDRAKSIAKQRNEIRNAPQVFATIGVAAGLRATLSRLTRWNASIKEFVHNVALTNQPDELTICEGTRDRNVWGRFDAITTDVSYEGRPAPVPFRDGRVAVFYQARRRVPRRPGATVPAGVRVPEETRANGFDDSSQLWFKMYDVDGWTPARRLTDTADVVRNPAALRTADGRIWVFYTQAAPDRANAARLGLLLGAFGRGDQAARLVGTVGAPVADGDVLRVAVDGGPPRDVTLRTEQFQDMANVSAAELARVLDGELPGVTVTGDGASVAFQSDTRGGVSQLQFAASTLATKLGLATAAAQGIAPASAQVSGARAEPFSLAGKQLVLRIDRETATVVTFTTETTAAQVAATINAAAPGVASTSVGVLRLASPSRGAGSYIVVDVAGSSAADDLGFAAPPPVSSFDDIEPAACEDGNGDVWLFWSSRRSEVWKILYSRFAGGAWGSPKVLTTGLQPDCEPSAIVQRGRLVVFWTRKKVNGLFNVFSRSTTNFNFPALTLADWTETELTPAPPNFDNREPWPLDAGAGGIELLFASNRTDGWQVWSKVLATGREQQVTAGPFTNRAPSGLAGRASVRVWLRSNRARVYRSGLYGLSETTDARSVGSTSFDTRNGAKTALLGDRLDIQRYTYHVRLAPGSTAPVLYARDAVGVYLTPDTADPDRRSKERTRITNALETFVPVQTRIVVLDA